MVEPGRALGAGKGRSADLRSEPGHALGPEVAKKLDVARQTPTTRSRTVIWK